MEKDKNYSRLLDEQIGLVARENRYLEFKSNYQDTDKLGRYISALSNGACLERQDFAYLYFGVKDETWDVIGTTFDVSKEKAKGNQSLEIYLCQCVCLNIGIGRDLLRVITIFITATTISVILAEITNRFYITRMLLYGYIGKKGENNVKFLFKRRTKENRI